MQVTVYSNYDISERRSRSNLKQIALKSAYFSARNNVKIKRRHIFID